MNPGSARLTYAPLAAPAWRDSAGNARLLPMMILAIAGTILLTVSAKVQVPFWPVPMTMQTFVAILIGVAYGWRLGAATVALYLLEGMFGLPIFAGTPERGIGLAYMTGPTGGYLIGFLLAAYVAGWLTERGWAESPLKLILLFLVGHVVIFVPGLAWLATLIGAEKTVASGLLPFLPGTIVKSLLGAGVVFGLRRTAS